MQVILLERVEKLGQMGDVVEVKSGYARNFLLPNHKALRATNENKAFFDGQKKVLEAENLKHKSEAEKLAKKIDGLKVVLIRQASEAGSLYGSVTSRDIADAVIEKGFKIGRSQVKLDRNYKLLGLFPIKVTLHPEVNIEVIINIARSADEAKLQEKQGGALVALTDAEEDAAIALEAAKKAEEKEKARDAEALKEVKTEDAAETPAED